jgi:hypothetical protein
MAIIYFKALSQQSKNKQRLRKIKEKLKEDLNRNRPQGKFNGLAICKGNRVRDRRKDSKPPSPPGGKKTGEDYE